MCWVLLSEEETSLKMSERTQTKEHEYQECRAVGKVKLGEMNQTSVPVQLKLLVEPN